MSVDQKWAKACRRRAYKKGLLAGLERAHNDLVADEPEWWMGGYGRHLIALMEGVQRTGELPKEEA